MPKSNNNHRRVTVQQCSRFVHLGFRSILWYSRSPEWTKMGCCWIVTDYQSLLNNQWLFLRQSKCLEIATQPREDSRLFLFIQQTALRLLDHNRRISFAKSSTHGVPCRKKSNQSRGRINRPWNSICSFSHIWGGLKGASPKVRQAIMRMESGILSRKFNSSYPKKIRNYSA